jgi:hypothetical protein
MLDTINNGNRTPESSRNRFTNSLLAISGVAAFLDTLIGGIASMGLDLSRTDELVMAISFVLGFPLYWLERRLKNRFAFLLFALFMIRWVIRGFIGPTFVIVNPIVWPVGILLFLSLVFLQWFKLKSHQDRVNT